MDIVQLYGESLQIFLMLAEQQVKSVSQRRSKLSCQIKSVGRASEYLWRLSGVT